jgi:hypothetical protein
MEFDIILKDAKNVIVLEWPGVIKDVLTERAFADRVVWVDLRYGLSASTERIFELHSSAKNEINSAI